MSTDVSAVVVKTVRCESTGGTGYNIGCTSGTVMTGTGTTEAGTGGGGGSSAESGVVAVIGGFRILDGGGSTSGCTTGRGGPMGVDTSCNNDLKK